MQPQFASDSSLPGRSEPEKPKPAPPPDPDEVDEDDRPTPRVAPPRKTGPGPDEK